MVFYRTIIDGLNRVVICDYPPLSASASRSKMLSVMLPEGINIIRDASAAISENSERSNAIRDSKSI